MNDVIGSAIPSAQDTQDKLMSSVYWKTSKAVIVTGLQTRCAVSDPRTADADYHIQYHRHAYRTRDKATDIDTSLID